MATLERRYYQLYNGREQGNVTLTGLTLVDIPTDGSGGSLTLTNSPSSHHSLGSSPGTLNQMR